MTGLDAGDATRPRTADDWSDRLAARIGGEVKRYRRRRGMSAQDLADRLAAVGHEIKRSTLANLESGRRGVSVADLLAIAAALDISPLLLAWPLESADSVEPLPDVQVSAWDGARWWRGDSDSPTRHAQEHGENAIVRLLSQHDATVADIVVSASKVADRSRRDELAATLDPAKRTEWLATFDETMRLAESRIARDSQWLKAIRARIAERGAAKPTVPPEIVPVMTLLGDWDDDA